jgi:signal transduction histidine kinase
LLEDDRSPETQPDRQRLLRIIASSTARLNLLVTRMLELARADMTGPTAIATAVPPILSRLAGLYRDRGLHVRLAGPDIAVTLPAEALEAVLVSLLDNVLAHAGPGATVRITTAATSHQKLIEVQDDGPGISPANQARAFDPFFTTAREAGSTGLGLPIARAILAGAAGTLDILPTERGAKFRMAFPSE